MSTKGYMLGPEQGVEAFAPGVKATQPSTDGSLTVIVSRSREGSPLHVHSKEDECFYVIEGVISVRCGEETFEAGPGSFLFLPRGIPHAREASSTEATVLLISVPAGFDEFMRELHQAGSLSDEVRDQIAAKYGITFVRPSTS